jgi:hypothetical protein
MKPELIAYPGTEELEKLAYLIALEFALAFHDMGWPEIREETKAEPKLLTRSAGA